MWVARAAAARFVRVHRLTYPLREDDVDRAIRRVGGRILTFRVLPVDEFRVGRTIGLRADLAPSRRLWLKLHAIGHLALHRGDQVVDVANPARQERQADEFAGYLALGGLDILSPPHELAESAGVPVDRVVHWLELVAEADIPIYRVVV